MFSIGLFLWRNPVCQLHYFDKGHLRINVMHVIFTCWATLQVWAEKRKQDTVSFILCDFKLVTKSKESVKSNSWLSQKTFYTCSSLFLCQITLIPCSDWLQQCVWALETECCMHPSINPLLWLNIGVKCLSLFSQTFWQYIAFGL